MKKLSDRQKKILDFITAFIEERGYSPSVRDVARGCDIRSSTVAQYHLNILEREGYICRDRTVPRSIVLPNKRAGLIDIPLLGTIAAGNPIPVPTADTWTTIPEETLATPMNLARGLEGIYALKVKGESMVDALIDDGDIILMQHTNTAEDGAMVAVWLKDEREVTLKHIYHEEDKICLKPANKLMKPVYRKPDNVEVQGRVIGVIRKL
jgi:repressor LexA